jgi:hypothetical protein
MAAELVALARLASSVSKSQRFLFVVFYYGNFSSIFEVFEVFLVAVLFELRLTIVRFAFMQTSLGGVLNSQLRCAHCRLRLVVHRAYEVEYKWPTGRCNAIVRRKMGFTVFEHDKSAQSWRAGLND